MLVEYNERMRGKIIILFIILFLGGGAIAADLPTKGKTPSVPSTVRGPGSHPGDPGTPAPIGSGLFILLGVSATYFLVKRKKNN